MHIIFITTGDITSIATMKRALGMANPLNNLGWNVSIIAEDTIENRKRIELECSNKISVYYFKKTNVINEILYKTRIVNRVKPDFIYFCSFSTRNYILKIRKNKRTKILIEHSELPSAIPDNRGVKKIKALLFEYYSMVYSSHLINASKYLMKVYEVRFKKMWWLKKKTMFYSPYAYNDDIINYPPVIIKKLKEEYKGKTVFLYMGTMTKNYGLFTMLQAAMLLLKEEKQFVLLLMGRGRHLTEAKEWVKQKGIEEWVKFSGYIPEVELSSYFELTDAFISPLNNSIQDKARCPSKIYMYLPYNKPILTSKIGEAAEVFGEKGLYFDTEKPEELTRLFLKVINKTIDINSIDIGKHSWKTRAFELNNWIKEDYELQNI